MSKLTKLWTAFLGLFYHQKVISQSRVEELYKSALTATCESDDGEQCSTLGLPDGCTAEELMLVAEYCKAQGNYVRVFHEIDWDEYVDEMKAYYLRIEFRAESFPPAVLFPFSKGIKMADCARNNYFLSIMLELVVRDFLAVN
jgi:hypothetical protein